MNRALLTQALAFLQGTEGDPAIHAFRAAIDGQADRAITAIEAALAAPLPFPCAWMDREGTGAVPDAEREAWLHAGEIEKYRDYSVPLFQVPPAIPRMVPGDAWQSEMGPPSPPCRVDYCETGSAGGPAPLVILVLQPGGNRPAPRVPKGMQLVPVTMTRDMLLAWYRAPAGHQDSDDEVRAGYRAILAAAPGARSGTEER
jgi:hypothetical protein